jgi:hypothetical protein
MTDTEPQAVEPSQSPPDAPKKETIEEKVERLQKELQGMLHVEAGVRRAATEFAKKYGIKDNHYRITLQESLKQGDMYIVSGPVVDIFFKYPQPKDKWAPMIRSAFSAISRRPDIRTPVEIVPVGWYKKLKGESRKWHKDRFGEFADVVMNMIPKHRLVESTTITHTLKDRVTGLEVSVSYPEGTRLAYDAGREMRVSLTRMVNSIEIEEDDVDVIEEAGVIAVGGLMNDIAENYGAYGKFPPNVVDHVQTEVRESPFWGLGETSWLFDRPDIES